MPSDGLGGPICVGRDYPHSCAVLVINKGVRATVVVDDYELQLGSWQPLQRRGNVARPNAPPGSVFKLDDMTLVVLCNQHRLAPSSQNDSIAPRIWVLPESPRPKVHAACVFGRRTASNCCCTACTKHRVHGWPFVSVKIGSRPVVPLRVFGVR